MMMKPSNTSAPSALESMMSGKTELAEDRLDVAAVQIMERLRIRSENLKELLNDELSVESKLTQLDRANIDRGLGTMGLEIQLKEQADRIRGAKRRETIECWRDLTHVMRDFLNAWEGFSKNQARNRFLSALPQPSKKPSSPTPYSIQNDHYNHTNNQR